MGIKDLNEAQVEINEVIKDVEQQFDSFYKENSKKYKDSTKEENLIAEGIASFLIQAVPDTNESDSIKIRRNLLNQFLDNISTDEAQSDYIEKARTALAKIDADSIEGILSNLKKEAPGNYESLVWMKDRLLPQFKEDLQQFQELFLNEQGDYSDPNYIPIRWRRAGGDVDPEKLGEVVEQFQSIAISSPQPKNTIRRIKMQNIPRDKSGVPMDLELNVRSNVFNSIIESVANSYSAPAWFKIKSFLTDPRASEALGGRDNVNQFIKRLGGLYYSRNRRAYLLEGSDRLMDVFATSARRIGSSAALGGFTQFPKQAADQIISTVIHSGNLKAVGENLFWQREAMPLLQRHPIGQRADVLAGTQFLNSSDAAFDRIGKYLIQGKLQQAKSLAFSLSEKWLSVLKASDVWAARAAWMTYYQQALKERGIEFKGWEAENKLYDTDTERQEAALQADTTTDIYQGASDPTKMALFAQRGRSGSENVLKGLFLPFNSFAFEQKMTMLSTARDVMNKSIDADGRKRAARGFAARLGGMITFNLVKVFLISKIYELGKDLVLYAFGVDQEEPSEEEKQDDYNFKWRKFWGGFAGDFLAGGGGTLASNFAIDQVNRIAYMTAKIGGSPEIKKKDGTTMSFQTYKRNHAPLWRYEQMGSGVDLGIFGVVPEQIYATGSKFSNLATPEYMDKFSPQEKGVIYADALMQALYTARMTDTDVYRIFTKAAKSVEETAEEREKKRAAARRKLLR